MRLLHKEALYQVANNFTFKDLRGDAAFLIRIMNDDPFHVVDS